MKKLTLAIAALSFVLVSCNNQPKPEQAVGNQPKQECENQKGQHKCCKDMSEEQKAMFEAWKDWDNQTPEKKAELIAKRKECIDKKIVEQETREAEMKVKKGEFKAKWANFDKLDIEAQKVLIDEFRNCMHPRHDGDMNREGCRKDTTPCKKQN